MYIIGMNSEYIDWRVKQKLHGEVVLSVHSSLGACVGVITIDEEYLPEIKEVLNVTIQS